MAGLLGSEIMDESALLLNDSAKVTFSYTAQTPWLKRAINDLSLELEANGIKLCKKIQATATVAANATTIPLPSDAVVAIRVEERLSGSSFPFNELSEVLALPAGLTASESIGFWAFEGTLLNSVPVLNILAPSTAREVRITYERFLPYVGVTSATDFSADLAWNAKIIISTKIAELITKFVLMNEKRYKFLKDELDRVTYRYEQIWTKNQQGSPVRKPHYKRF